MKKTYETIDLAKLLASVLVFAMHCGVLGDYEEIRIIPQLLSRWAVPFFFICSSYLLFKTNHRNVEKTIIKKYVSRIGILYGIWFLYNIPNVFYMRFLGKDLTSVGTWLTFVKESLLSSTFTGSWYLLSSVFSACFIYVLSKRLRTKNVLGISLVFYLLCVFSSAYSGVLPQSILNKMTFLCFPLNIFNGCFYFALGKYLAEKEQSVTKLINKKRAFIAFLIFYFLFLAEIVLTKYFKISGGTDITFSTAIMAMFLFLFCLQSKLKVKNSILLRKLSTIIYCAQGNILLINTFCKIQLKIPSIIAFLISAIIMTVICTIIIIIQKRKDWKWTKYLT